MPALDPLRPFQRGERMSLPPARLRALVDQLVEDATLAWRMVGADPAAPAMPMAAAEEIFRWSEILDDAREMELASAPAPVDYILTGAGAVLGVAGIGLALTGPLLGSVVAVISAVVGVAGGLLSFAAGIPLIRRDVA